MTPNTTQSSIYQPTEDDSTPTTRADVGGYVSGAMMNMNGAVPGGTSSQGVSCWRHDRYDGFVLM